MNGIPDWCEQAAWNIAKSCEQDRAGILNLSILPDAPVRCYGPAIIYQAYLDWQRRDVFAGELHVEDCADLPATDQYARDCSGWKRKPG